LYIFLYQHKPLYVRISCLYQTRKKENYKAFWESSKTPTLPVLVPFVCEGKRTRVRIHESIRTKLELIVACKGIGKHPTKYEIMGFKNLIYRLKNNTKESNIRKKRIMLAGILKWKRREDRKDVIVQNRNRDKQRRHRSRM